MTRKGAHLTDQDLILAAHPAHRTHSGRAYQATYKDGQQVVFHVEAAEFSRVYAQEYGMRFLGGAKVLNVRWLR